MRKLAILLLFFCAIAEAQQPKYETVYFQSGSLKIEGYVFQPGGKGPWPAIIYNHGSREGAERDERPFTYIANAFVPAGYVVFVIERRGYGKSDGATFTEDVQHARDERYVNRLVAEAQDVLAGTDYLKQQPYVDKDRVAIMGWSLGGIMTVLATSQRSDYCAAVDQAAGALSWLGSPELRAKLTDAASQIKVPLLSMVAQNDAATDAMTTIDKHVPATTAHRGIIYPAYHPLAPMPGVAPGHLIFSPGGVVTWKPDVLAWFGQNCAAKPH
jgi:dienelactone hydrolase